MLGPGIQAVERLRHVAAALEARLEGGRSTGLTLVSRLPIGSRVVIDAMEKHRGVVLYLVSGTSIGCPPRSRRYRRRGPRTEIFAPDHAAAAAHLCYPRRRFLPLSSCTEVLGGCWARFGGGQVSDTYNLRSGLVGATGSTQRRWEALGPSGRRRGVQSQKRKHLGAGGSQPHSATGSSWDRRVFNAQPNGVGSGVLGPLERRRGVQRRMWGPLHDRGSQRCSAASLGWDRWTLPEYPPALGQGRWVDLCGQ